MDFKRKIPFVFGKGHPAFSIICDLGVNIIRLKQTRLTWLCSDWLTVESGVLKSH